MFRNKSWAATRRVWWTWRILEMSPRSSSKRRYPSHQFNAFGTASRNYRNPCELLSLTQIEAKEGRRGRATIRRTSRDGDSCTSRGGIRLECPLDLKSHKHHSSLTVKALTRQGYRIVGSHSGVKLCRWTKSMLRGRGTNLHWRFLQH